MTTVVIAPESAVTETEAAPFVLSEEWIVDIITEHGPQTVAELVARSGRSETSVRKLLKTLVANGALWKDAEAKPATFEVIVETTEDDVIPVVDEAAVIEAPEGTSNVAEVETKGDDAKIDEIMSAITAAPAKPKTSKSKKVAHTDVPFEHNFAVRLNGEKMLVTEAYALLVNPPTFSGADEAYAWENAALDRSSGDHSPEEIAGAYYSIVAAYLEHLYDEGQISRGVWYGRTFRLRRTLVGNGKGTATARPATKTTDQ